MTEAERTIRNMGWKNDFHPSEWFRPATKKELNGSKRIDILCVINGTPEDVLAYETKKPHIGD